MKLCLYSINEPSYTCSGADKPPSPPVFVLPISTMHTDNAGLITKTPCIRLLIYIATGIS